MPIVMPRETVPPPKRTMNLMTGLVISLDFKILLKDQEQYEGIVTTPMGLAKWLGTWSQSGYLGFD